MTGAELKALRRRLGLTQAQLAEKIGVWRNTIARQERGEVTIPGPTARLYRLLTKGPRKTTRRRRR